MDLRKADNAWFGAAHADSDEIGSTAQNGGYFSAAAARLITRRDKRNREVRILPAG
jgi:hypothetical protein